MIKRRLFLGACACALLIVLVSCPRRGKPRTRLIFLGMRTYNIGINIGENVITIWIWCTPMPCVRPAGGAESTNPLDDAARTSMAGHGGRHLLRVGRI